MIDVEKTKPWGETLGKSKVVGFPYVNLQEGK